MATNFAYSTVATAPSPATSGTSLVVAAADGAKFPAVPFRATVWPAGVRPTTTNAEVITVTAIATDTLTIVRAEEGSTARTVIVTDQIAATLTAESVPIGSILDDKTATDRNYTLLSSSDFMALDTLEVGSSSVIEVPATSTLEVYSPPLNAKAFINPYKFSAWKSSGTQTINTGSYQKITFDVEEFDTNGNFTSSTYTIPVSGYYSFAAVLSYNAVASGTRLIAALYKNGVQVKKGDDRDTTAAAGSAILVVPCLQVSVGDFVEVYGQPVGANTVITNVQTDTWFMGIYISAL